MIVTCQRCASQFRLDEAKIPPQGVRLRCSRCEHVFFVESPERPDTDHARDLARDALTTAKSEVGSESTAEPANPPSSRELSTESNDSIGPDSIEEDWEFNDDDGAIASPIGDGDALSNELTAAREAVDDLLGGVGDLDLSTPVAEDADSAFSPALEFDVAEPAAPTLGGDAPEITEPRARVEDEPALEAEPAETGDDDFDDPANWDLFDSETSGAVAVGAVEPRAVAQSPALNSGAPIGETRPALSGLTAPGPSKLQLLAGIAGWVVVVPLLAFGLVGGLLAPHFQPEPRWVESAAAPGFELQGVSARWIDNAISGRLYVISGQLRRSRGSSPSNATGLAVRLLDANGLPLGLPLSAIGSRIAERSLREASPADLVKLQNRRAAHFASTASRWLSFAAVVPVVPDLAERFEFSPLEPDAGS